jgi:hypothetical protein
VHGEMVDSSAALLPGMKLSVAMERLSNCSDSGMHTGSAAHVVPDRAGKKRRPPRRGRREPESDCTEEEKNIQSEETNHFSQRARTRWPCRRGERPGLRVGPHLSRYAGRADCACAVRPGERQRRTAW